MHFWQKEKFWLAVVTAALVILNEGLGLNVPPEVVWPVVLLIFGWLFTDGVVEAAASIREAVIISAKLRDNK